MKKFNSVIEGRCRCGDIRYKNKGPFVWVGHCHCDDCRRSSGGCVATFIAFKSQDFEYSQGSPKTYRSSPGISRSFCGGCGTPMSYENEKFEGQIHIHLGTLNSPDEFPALVHLFEREKLTWFKLSDDALRFETLPSKYRKDERK